MADDLNKDTKHVNLVEWANQGVLLLNSILTVRESFPGSHRNKGWEIFTDFLIESLVNERKNLIFIIWGAQAKKKITSIDLSNHYILESPHPRPYHRTEVFLGANIFQKQIKF